MLGDKKRLIAKVFDLVGDLGDVSGLGSGGDHDSDVHVLPPF